MASSILYDQLGHLPAALIITTGYDPLRDESLGYENRLREAGVEVEYNCFDTTIHGFDPTPEFRSI